MNILFLAQRLPYPPIRGDKIRAFKILEYISKEHKVWLACITENKEDLKFIEKLNEFCQRVEVVFMSIVWRNIKCLLNLFQNKPFTLIYFYSKKLEKKIKEILEKEKIELIYISSSSMAQYVLNIENIPKIMDFVDCDSDKWRQFSQFAQFPHRFIYHLESKRLREFEKKISEKVEHCIVVSQEELETFSIFLDKDKLKKFLIVSNGVDFDYFKSNINKKEEKNLIFVGTMNYLVNVDAVLYFVKEIFPLIKKEIPEIRFYIVGAEPVAKIRKLAKDKAISVTGYVKDTRPYLERAMIFVAPLRINRGIQNKILEAMAMGLVVVATTKACYGIKTVCEKALIIEDEPYRFAQKLIHLLRNRELRLRLSEDARKLIEENFDWNVKLKEIDKIIDLYCKN